MSRTYDLVCKECKSGLWIGQSNTSLERGGHIYTGIPTRMEMLADFLFSHMGHSLLFQEDQLVPFEYEDLRTEDPNEMMYCPNCDFELPVGAACGSICPECHTRLRTWDTSDGTRPGKRPFTGHIGYGPQPHLPARRIEDE